MKKLKILSTLCLVLVSVRSNAAGLFIKVNGSGTYEITVDEQLQHNSNGNFRFFEVPTGNIQVRITEGNSAFYVYDHVVDKGSCFVVEKTFTYNSSKDELEKYISNR